MKLTETQRKFKKETAKLNREENENSIYDKYYYRGEETSSNRGNSRKTFAVILLIAIIGIAAWNYGKRYLPQNPSSLGNTQQFTPVVSSGSNVPGSRTLPPSDARFLNSIIDNLKRLDVALDEVSKYNKLPRDQRNTSEYKQALLNALVTCNEVENAIKNLETPAKFNNLVRLVNDILTHYKSALSNWHDAASTNQNSSIERGNKFMNAASEKRKQFMTEIENYLKSNGYKYEKTTNGINYWYSK